MLRFSEPNLKLKKLQKKLGLKRNEICSFDLPPAITCNPSCKFRSMGASGKLQKGNMGDFPSCYTARADAQYPRTWRMRTRNYAALLSSDNMEKLIEKSIPEKVKVIRLHTSGDFFSYEYMLAWYNIAKNNPSLIIYTYTKQISFLLKLRKLGLPKNLRIVGSYGSNADRLITRYNVPWARAIDIADKKRYKGIPVNTDDYPAYCGKCSVIYYH